MAAPKRSPAFQFYPGDWRKDPGVQSLGYEERGIWFELLMIMHDATERGTLTLNSEPMSLEDIANLLRVDLICSECSKTLAKASKGNAGNSVSVGDLQGLFLANTKCTPSGLLHFCFSKTLAKLLAKGVAKVWQNSGKIYNARMVRDEAAKRANEYKKEQIREYRRRAGRKGGLAKAKQKSTMSSSSSSEKSNTTPLNPPSGGTKPRRSRAAQVAAVGGNGHLPEASLKAIVARVRNSSEQDTDIWSFSEMESQVRYFCRTLGVEATDREIQEALNAPADS